MSKLAVHDVVGNCRYAFDAAESLGIPRVIEPLDMSMLSVPDKLAVMTYLYQLRAHFTGHQLQLEQLGSTTDESSYVIGNYKSDNQPLKLDRSKLNTLSSHHPHHQFITALDEDGVEESRSPTEKKDVKNLILSGSRNLLGRVLSPTKDRAATGNGGGEVVTPPVVQPAVKPVLMTRRELTDPFGSDEEDETSNRKAVNGSTMTTTTKETSVIAAPTLDPATTNVSIEWP